MRWSYQEEVRPNVQLGHKSVNVEMVTNCSLTTDRILLSPSIQPTDCKYDIKNQDGNMFCVGHCNMLTISGVHIPSVSLFPPTMSKRSFYIILIVQHRMHATQYSAHFCTLSFKSAVKQLN